MTRRFTHALAALYALTAVALLHAAITAAHTHPWPYTGLLAGAACCLAIATVHHSLQRDEIRDLLRNLDATERTLAAERAATDEDGVIAVAMAAWCCDAWITTDGAEHDPATCTRKDHHA